MSNKWKFVSTLRGNNQFEFNFYKPNGQELTWEDFFVLFHTKDPELNTIFRSALNQATDQLGAYFWDCLPVSTETLNRPFRFVVTKSEALKNATQDWKKFDKHLAALDKPAISFLSHSEAGILVVPKVTKSGNQELDYKNISQFTKNAPEDQQKEFWWKVALEMYCKLKQSKDFCFLNTQGLGVSYLHVWVCEKQPRHWNYNEYLKFDKNIPVSETPQKPEKENGDDLKKDKQELQNLINQGQNQENIEYLKATLEKIEQKSSTSAYQELKTQIDSLHFKLNSKLSISEVQQKEVSKLKLLLTQNNLEKEDLPTETQTELDNLKNLTDLTQINNSKNKVNEVIHKKGAEKVIQTLLDKINYLSENASQKEKDTLKKELDESLKSSNHYIREHWENHHSKKEQALKKLSTADKKDQSNSSPKSGLSSRQRQKAAIGIGAGVVVLGLSVLAIKLIRFKKKL
ncbi:MAG: hypothetical protein MRERC_5c025 [Mycoplasmataceae bacterium RC_NB112A]|nr:MAG: hypothetical protein MRERC_5c025 [Mycoplasmataceae bacterium RC_NB112A]